MSANVAIFYLLNNNAATTGAVGGRIFPDVAPQRYARPAIVINVVSQIPSNTLGIGGFSRLDICRVQITIGATTRKQATDIGNLVRNVLKDVNNQTCDGVFVNSCRFDSSNEYYDDFSDQDGLFILAQDYKVAIQV